MLRLVSIILALAVAVEGLQTLVPEVAVIGGGVGAASAAHFLRRQLGAGVRITVFEASDQLGGRAHTVEVDKNVTVELGASIIWAGNRYMHELAAAAGLRSIPPGSQSGVGDRPLALYDGRELILTESPWWWLTLLKAVWRWGLSWIWFLKRPGQFAERFSALYAALDNGTAWAGPADMLKQLQLRPLTEVSLLEWIRENYQHNLDDFAAEAISAVNLVNYGQGNELNTFAGLVSLLPATDPHVFAIEGGNQRLPTKVLAAAANAIHTSAAVGTVRRLDSGQYQLALSACRANCSSSAADAGDSRAEMAAVQVAAPASAVYDAVVIAAPLELAGLTIEGVPVRLPARQYHQTVATLVCGTVRPSYFGLSSMTYGAIMRTRDAGVPWNSLSLVAVTRSNVTVWKLFSNEPMPHAWLSMIFEADFEVLFEKAWKAYPQFDPPEDYARWELAEGLVYLNAIENAASAMEMSAIAGRNGAQLVANYLASTKSRGAGAAAAA